MLEGWKEYWEYRLVVEIQEINMDVINTTMQLEVDMKK